MHGFDGVHIVVNDDKKQLWLGESKIYENGKDGVKELAKDLKKHLKEDYLRREFNLLSTKLPESAPEIDHWRKLLHENQRLENILSSICIPMVCTYSSQLFSKHVDKTKEYIVDFIAEMKDLEKTFDEKVIKTNVDVLLMLLPIESKANLINRLDEKLKHMQKI